MLKAWTHTVAIGASLFAFSFQAASPASAQSAAPTAIKAEAGKPAMIGYYSFVRNDCSGGGTPKFSMKQEPQHGTVTVKPGTLTTKKLQQCGAVKAPTVVVVYQAKAGFSGTESLAFDIVNSDTGKAQTIAVTVTVTAPNTAL